MIAVTILATILFYVDSAGIVARAWHEGRMVTVLQYIGVLLAVAFPIYGNLIYQFSRLGYFVRLSSHRPVPQAQLEERLYTAPAPALTVLIPSYKEEHRTISQTVLSAALQEYPRRRVVLLIDDPYNSPDPADQRHLTTTRALIRELHKRLAEPAAWLAEARNEFLASQRAGRLDPFVETRRLAEGYDYAADWFASYAATLPQEDHTDRFFHTQILAGPRTAHRQRAAEFRALLEAGRALPVRQIAREYARLAGLFAVEITSFERKRYANLSHEANKAMNLNSYLALIGRNWRERLGGRGPVLSPHAGPGADLIIPPTDYVITLDADSLLLPGYALRLVEFMERPEHARVGVVQTPYSAIPGATNPIERVAGATTDIQYLVHQGFTHFNATFWVGANALIRKAAIDDIRSVSHEGAQQVVRYIQDRTVIEDTESTLDLTRKGWRLHNYPERLAYSATPPDFGALLIQRRRWANGGLLIFPKLVRYLRRARHEHRLVEGVVRAHYLISLGGVSVGMLLLLLLPPQSTLLSAWLPLTTLPYHLLYGRDLVRFGYRPTDLVRVYGLNLLLIPINLGGVIKSLHQAMTGTKIPFGRTPKVLDRTAAPATYILAELALCGCLLYAAAIDVSIGRWGLAAFALANFLVLAYSIVRFIGVRAGVEDISLAALALVARRPAARPASVPEPRPAAIVLRQPAAEEPGRALEPSVVYATIDLRQSR